jgi:hypothetical protein
MLLRTLHLLFRRRTPIALACSSIPPCSIQWLPGLAPSLFNPSPPPSCTPCTRLYARRASLTSPRNMIMHLCSRLRVVVRWLCWPGLGCSFESFAVTVLYVCVPLRTSTYSQRCGCTRTECMSETIYCTCVGNCTITIHFFCNQLSHFYDEWQRAMRFQFRAAQYKVKRQRKTNLSLPHPSPTRHPRGGNCPMLVVAFVESPPRRTRSNTPPPGDYCPFSIATQALLCRCKGL